MSLATRSSLILALAAATLSGCELFGIREADLRAQAQAQPGESWLYAYSNDPVAKTTTLLMIDPVTGTAHPIGSAVPGLVDALAFDPIQRVLYGAWQTGNGPNAASELVTIDWYTGAVTPVGPLATNQVGTPSNAKVQGMSVAADGTLVALTHSPQRLIEIDPTADFTYVADLDFALHSYDLSFMGSTLYALNATNQHFQVYEVDRSNGQGTRHKHEQPGGFSIGATTDGAGTFYAVLGDELHTIDMASYGRNWVADVGWTHLGSLAWIDEPLDQLALEDVCPCEHDWSNHGEYVSCVAHWADAYAAPDDHGDIVSEAARSECGHKH